MRIKQISCEVCQDLLPLVEDGVASPESRTLVEEHTMHCASCSGLLDGTGQRTLPNDKEIVGVIRKRLLFSGFTVLILGAFVGVYLSNSMGMFYNFVIMPAVGATAYFTLGKRWPVAPLGVLILTYLWLFAGYIVKYRTYQTEIIDFPIFLALIYTALTFLGVLIGALLKFALKSEA